MLATPADQVRAEVRRVAQPLPALLQPFEDDPAAAVAALADLVRAYWERALAPHWERIRALLEGDVLYRARRLADAGAQRLFADIHPELALRRRHALHRHAVRRAPPTSRGAGCCSCRARSPGRGRPPRSSAGSRSSSTRRAASPSLWDPARAAPPAALAALLGARRASVLSALHAPRSTTELARALELSPGSVSQHLSVLRDAGLVNAHRVGRVVLYVRSPTGDAVVA